ncbi:TnsA endonuclease N-terminal domain-containing protein [Acetobacter sp.]|jgi:hypothetical protein|uniref:TnsA endonuclease N-terminal domain-containing protein n=1 Tax=Acetobacter sp. TaxID=440 RepID=UPI0025B91930|nr:TnsA endonuclease N-terminal domain-containing protein [Acetobacter sp.]MCI1301343.1 hypothetical protein [Acetobacter sp.]
MQQRHGLPWSRDEDEILQKALKNGVSIKSLSIYHRRGVGAIYSRLKRLGLEEAEPTSSLPSHDSISLPSVVTSLVSAAETDDPKSKLLIGVDQLLKQLNSLREEIEFRSPRRRVISSVARAYDRLYVLLRDAAVEPEVDEEAQLPNDPLPDRLRAALIHAVEICVSDPIDQIVALKVLGFEGTGERVTLAEIGLHLARSPERVRQRRKRAFRLIDANLSRRKEGTDRIRNVLNELSADADWRDPVIAATNIVKFVTTNVVAAKQLALMLVISAGATDDLPTLRRTTEKAALDACRDPELLGTWKTDRWSDIATKTVIHGSFAVFDAPPQDMLDRKRLPTVGSRAEAIPLESPKLQRIVLCESGMELSVFKWFEKSEDIVWYQEQPISFPYISSGRQRRYFPDAVVQDTNGNLTVVEVKPVFRMFRRHTLEKGIAALEGLEPRGIGYLLVDSTGRSLSDFAKIPYEKSVAEEIEAAFCAEAVPFHIVKNIIIRLSGKFSITAFISMVINRDWSVTETPVMISRLPASLSFHPFLIHCESPI